MSNQYTQDIIEKSEDINSECRKILTNGFFHVYGIQVDQLEKKMVEKINEIEKNMAKFNIDKTLDKSIIDLKTNKCTKYMELLNQEVLKNLLIRLWNNINNKESGMKHTASTTSASERNYYQAVIKEADDASSKEVNIDNMPGIKQAVCSIIIDYFNQFLTN